MPPHTQVVVSSATIVRQPSGTPVGGQFAPQGRMGPDGSVTLADPDGQTVDGSDGSDGGGEDESPLRRRYDTFEEKLSAFQGELERGVEGLREDENWKKYLNTMTKFHRYSPSNQLLISLQRPDATLVAGFRRWGDVGRHVKKGERGIGILAPKMRWVDEKDAAGNPRVGDDGKPKKRQVVTGFTTATVFDVSQTDGEPIPEGARKLSKEPPEGFTDDLTAAIEAHGYEVAYEKIPGSANGYTTLRGPKRVVIDEGLSPGQRAKTLAHELGHIEMGHTDPNNSGEYHEGHGGRRGAMEVEAESFSYVLCRANGMDAEETGGYSYAYVGGWSGGGGDVEVVRQAAENVAKAVKSSLASRTWANVEPDPVEAAPRREPERKPAARSKRSTRGTRARAGSRA